MATYINCSPTAIQYDMFLLFLGKFAEKVGLFRERDTDIILINIRRSHGCRKLQGTSMNILKYFGKYAMKSRKHAVKDYM